MNSQLIQQGRAAYRAGDYSAAAQMLGASKIPSEIMGEADHLRGNALMHLGMYAEAAEAYAMENGCSPQASATFSSISSTIESTWRLLMPVARTK